MSTPNPWPMWLATEYLALALDWVVIDMMLPFSLDWHHHPAGQAPPAAIGNSPDPPARLPTAMGRCTGEGEGMSIRVCEQRLLVHPKDSRHGKPRQVEEELPRPGGCAFRGHNRWRALMVDRLGDPSRDS